MATHQLEPNDEEVGGALVEVIGIVLAGETVTSGLEFGLKIGN